jgi:hypothetical protein
MLIKYENWIQRDEICFNLLKDSVISGTFGSSWNSEIKLTSDASFHSLSKLSFSHATNENV